MEGELSNSTAHNEEGDVTVDFNSDIDPPAVAETTLHTKMANIIHRAIGDSSDLTLLDKIRQSLKESKKGKKPSAHKVEQYRTLTAKLHHQVCSARHEMKSQDVKFEHTYYKQHGVFPDRSTCSDYSMLRSMTF